MAGRRIARQRRPVGWAVDGADPGSPAGWPEQMPLAQRVEALVWSEAQRLPAPRTATERQARAAVLAAVRSVVLATLTQLERDIVPASGGGAERSSERPCERP